MIYITYNAHRLIIPCIEEPEILHVIAQLKNSAAGHDSLPGSIMKQCADKYIVPLTHIINLYITEGYFKEKFKLAKVCLYSKVEMNKTFKIIDQFKYYHFENN